MPEVPSSVLGFLASHDDFVIASHLDPDGDSLGSSLALALALDAVGKGVEVVIGQELPARLAWLPQASRIGTATRAPSRARAAILIECSDFGRCGVDGLRELPSLNIDHHSQNRVFADVNWIDPGVAAAGMMIEPLVQALGVPMRADMATLLYVTVFTDTGSFNHSNTDAAALAFAARMVEAGTDPERVADEVYGHVPAGRVRLMADALATLQLSAGGRLAVMQIDGATFARHGTRDTEGLINVAQRIEGVSVSVLLKAAEDGSCRVSLRSDGTIDVAALAAAHGGGGHPRAAGMAWPGPLQAATAAVTRLLDEALRRAGNP